MILAICEYTIKHNRRSNTPYKLDALLTSTQADRGVPDRNVYPILTEMVDAGLINPYKTREVIELTDVGREYIESAKVLQHINLMLADDAGLVACEETIPFTADE